MSQGYLNEQITRSLAYMLRHQPEEFDLELDAHGYGEMGDVVRALNERLGEPIEEGDVRAAIDSGDRQRYEIEGDRIRALYGHSIHIEPGEPAEPPELLYVGVGSRDAGRAESFGLKGGRRTFLHLALTYEDAQETGRRIAPEYAVITVHASEAFGSGVAFYDRKSLFLAEEIPTEFLELGEVHTDGILRAPRGDRFADRRGGRHGRRDDRDRNRGGRGDSRGFEEQRERPSRFDRDRPRREPDAPREETVARPDPRPRSEEPAPRTAAAPEPAKKAASGGFGLGIFVPPAKEEAPREQPAEREPAREPTPEPPEPRETREPPEEVADDSAGGFGSGVF
ncbi:MAG: hypothetical protein E2O39_15980 [Planctomycetota bacterium]|nr:MAG: hypothetical protein E2O39_15980 [Planctomycetota bacterium]